MNTFQTKRITVNIYAVTYSQQGVVLQLGVTIPHLKKLTCYGMLHRASDLAEGVQELGCEKNIWT